MQEKVDAAHRVEDTLQCPSDERIWAQTYLAKPLEPGKPGRLNPEFSYYELQPGRELALSPVARAVLEWCQTERSFESLFQLSCENFPEQAAVIEHELTQVIPALLKRSLLECTSEDSRTGEQA